MNKSKIVLVASCIFSLVFLVYIFKMSRDLSRVEDIIASSPNVVDVTDKIQTKLLVTSKDFKGTNWAASTFDDTLWATVQIPKHRIVSESEFKENNFAYYRIHIPKDSFKHLVGLENQLSIALQYVQFSKIDFFLNGIFYRSNTPIRSIDFITNLPIADNIDNVIGIKGSIKTGDSGINHRGRILVGKGSELNDFYSKSYKSMTVRGLIFLLCKGSILLIFTLLFLVLKVDRFFEKSLLYAMFVVLEDILTGDYVYGVFNLNQQVYLYDLVDLGVNTFLFLFIADVLQINFKRKLIYYLVGIVGTASIIISLDLLHTSYVFNIDHLLKFWNYVFICNLVFFMSRLYKYEKVFFTIALIAVSMTTWSALFSSNVGMNLKAFGNLLIFFGVAYQTFILFRRQQIQLFEQEKDVAIGKTAALLAHDVRRPLDQMSLILDKISNGDSTEEFLRVAKQDVEFSIVSVDNHINDIMNFTRTQKVSRDIISFYKILSSSIKQHLSTKPELDLKLKFMLKGNTKILGDESRLANVLTNLISNAVEAIQEIGGSNTGLITFSSNIENDRFVFKISNSGPHIKKEIISEIFKPLFTYGKTSGTGLGLASVSKILKDFEADIEVKNLEPVGVEFLVRFKTAYSEDPAGDYDFFTDSKKYLYSKSCFKNNDIKDGLRVFLLDEDIKTYENLMGLVKQFSFETEIFYANSITKAEKLLESKKFDLIIINEGHKESSIIEFVKCNPQFFKHSTVFSASTEFQNMSDLEVSKIVTPINSRDFLDICQKANGLREKILLVEDSKIITMGWLMYYGRHNVQSVSNPIDAIKFLETNPFIDICVLDYHFDGYEMNGVELGELIWDKFNIRKIYISSSAEIYTTKFRKISKGQYRL